jgi:hypothetical protein
LVEGGVIEASSTQDGTRWIVLTPSADDLAWRRAISEAAAAVNIRVVDARGVGSTFDDPNAVYVTDDANVALAAQGSEVVGIIPDPETAPDAVAEIYKISPPTDAWHASLLLARALSLSESHAVITASHLVRRPCLLKLFGDLEIVPPQSSAEASRRPIWATALSIYRDPESGTTNIPWSERLFIYDDKGSRDQPEWGMLDITGKPRILVWGPYLAMPPGRWRAIIRFAVDLDAARHTYRLDWGTQSDCVSAYVTPKVPGVYEAELEWEFSEPAPAEIRLILTEGSFMGTLMFQGIKVSRVPQTTLDFVAGDPGSQPLETQLERGV